MTRTAEEIDDEISGKLEQDMIIPKMANEDNVESLMPLLAGSASDYKYTMHHETVRDKFAITYSEESDGLR